MGASCPNINGGEKLQKRSKKDTVREYGAQASLIFPLLGRLSGFVYIEATWPINGVNHQITPKVD
jgi:hypothetical protein